MDFDSTLATVGALLPEQVGTALGTVASVIPKELDFLKVMQFMLFFAAATLVCGVLSRVILGKRSSLNHSLSAAMAVLFIYALSAVVYTFQPWNLTQLLSPLPFVSFHDEYLKIFSFGIWPFTDFCTELLWLVILTFLVNLLDTFMPKGNNVFGWLILRAFTIVLAMVLHLIVHWAFNTYLPGAIVSYAPTVLLCILLVMIFMGLINLILSALLVVVNPLFGALYAFFFSNAVGKQLTKAVFSAAIVGVVLFLMYYFGYNTIAINAPALLTYFPLGGILLILWYLVGHVL